MPARWRRSGTAALITAVAALGILLDRSCRQVPRGNDWDRYHDQTFRVVRVIDGDTFDIDAPDKDGLTTRIRLWGVDAPETGTGDSPPMHFGAEAKKFAEDTLTGKSVHVVLSPEHTRGKYGRLLAYVYLSRGGMMFNEMLLAEGYAYADFRFPHHDFKQFQTIEQRARREARGLWAKVATDDMPSWRQRYEREPEGATTDP